MLSKVWAFLRGERPEPLQETVDPVLGKCVPDGEHRWWRVTVGSGDGVISFILGGDTEPDAEIVEHARRIATDATAFKAGIREFLLREASCIDHPEEREVVANLELEEVCLFW